LSLHPMTQLSPLHCQEESSPSVKNEETFCSSKKMKLLEKTQPLMSARHRTPLSTFFLGNKLMEATKLVLQQDLMKVDSRNQLELCRQQQSSIMNNSLKSLSVCDSAVFSCKEDYWKHKVDKLMQDKRKVIRLLNDKNSQIRLAALENKKLEQDLKRK